MRQEKQKRSERGKKKNCYMVRKKKDTSVRKNAWLNKKREKGSTNERKRETKETRESGRDGGRARKIRKSTGEKATKNWKESWGLIYLEKIPDGIIRGNKLFAQVLTG